MRNRKSRGINPHRLEIPSLLFKLSAGRRAGVRIGRNRENAEGIASMMIIVASVLTTNMRRHKNKEVRN
jgi:hypothetical protein